MCVTAELPTSRRAGMQRLGKNCWSFVETTTPVRSRSTTEGSAVFHGNGVGLLRLLPFDRLPLEKPIHRHDAAPPAISIPERRKITDGLTLRVDRLASAQSVFAPMWNEAHELVAEIHDRMPVILAREAYERWLGEEPDPHDLMRPFPVHLMRMWPISTRVNKFANDDPAILEPIT
jgi:SOS response associated peptidase (SRAP)